MQRRLTQAPDWLRGLIALVALTTGLAAVVGPAELADYVIRGIPLGSVFALLAVGIVLTFKTSGVLNLAFAAQAFVSAAIFYDLRQRHEWPTVAAFVVAVVIAAPLLGLLLDRLLFRHLRTATQLARLVTSLGLLVAIPELTKIWFGRGAAPRPPSIAPDGDRIYRFGNYSLDQHQLVTVVLTLVVVVALSALFRWSTVGLRMRAVVESPRMTELNGINADRISAFSWMLSSFFAGLAGVLLAPFFPAQLDALNFFTLLVAALAAAAFGRLSSIPLTFLGALLLAVTMNVLRGSLPADHFLSQNVGPALPFVALILLLLFWPGLRRGRETTDPLAGVDPPPPAPTALHRPHALAVFSRAFGVVVVVGSLIIALTALDDFWLSKMTVAVILSIIFLSITVLTGMGGLVSLCQATFAAIGAFATAQLVNEAGLDVMTAVAVGAGVAALVGALLALPSLRVGGVYLALVTLAFAIAFETVLVPRPWVSGGPSLSRVPRPTIGPLDFADDRLWLLLCVVSLALVAVIVLLLRRGTTGHFLDALRGSETAAMSVGINPARWKFVAFAASAAIAGFGGGLLVAHWGVAGEARYQADFSFFLGLVWVVLVVTLGSRSVQAAIIGGVAFVLVPELLEILGVDPLWAVVLFGLGALTYARHPEGIIEANTRSFVRLLSRGSEHRSASTRASGDEPATAAVSAGDR